MEEWQFIPMLTRDVVLAQGGHSSQAPRCSQSVGDFSQSVAIEAGSGLDCTPKNVPFRKNARGRHSYGIPLIAYVRVTTW